MPERERKQKPAPKEREEEIVEDAPATSERGEKLKEDIDDLLDEIDSVLEDNAEEFREKLCAEGWSVTTYKQSGDVSPGTYARVVKTCSICGETKPLDDFYRAAGMRDGHRSDCKSCNLATRRAKYIEDPRKHIERVQRWQRENPDRYRAKLQDYAASGKKKVSDRKSHLKRKYGLTLEAFDELLAAQGGGCAICGKPDVDNVDHDHVTGRVRGILCWDCNIAIGKFEDDEDRLIAAATYLGANSELAELARTRVVALSS